MRGLAPYFSWNFAATRSPAGSDITCSDLDRVDIMAAHPQPVENNETDSGSTIHERAGSLRLQFSAFQFIHLSNSGILAELEDRVPRGSEGAITKASL